MVTNIHPENWYTLETEWQSDVVLCGDCALENYKKTESGEYTGDEAVTLNMLQMIRDADTEPYQCDQCMKQNDAYDEEFGDD